MSEKLQKFLSRAGIGSRRFCEKLIHNGEVTINNKIASIGDRVNDSDHIIYKDNIIKPKKSKTRLLLLNKPEGVLCSSKRINDSKIIYDFIPNEFNEQRWICIGRLDQNTSGLIFFTNDGDFANFCMHPSSNFDREYLVRAKGNFDESIRKKMLAGIKFKNDFLSLSDIIQSEKSDGANKWYSVCLMTGKNREVRRIFEYFNLVISRLKRTRFGPIFLPASLKKGSLIELEEKYIKQLKTYGE